MPENRDFERYAEALTALSTVDELERGALRRAMHDSTEAAFKEKTRQADQQRMFDRASRDLQEAQRGLDGLRTKLGVAFAQSHNAPTPDKTRTLAELRTDIARVTDWSARSEPIVASLLRTRARLEAAASSPAPDPQPATADLPPAPVVARKYSAHRRRLIIGMAGAIMILVVVGLILANVIQSHE